MSRSQRNGAARTVTTAIRTLTGERDLAVGIVACLQTHGSRANWHPHRHLLVTDGGFRPDGTYVSWPAHDTARLTEAFRRAVLRLFVRLELFDEDQAAGMRTRPHSGFHVHTAVWEGPYGCPRSIARSPPRGQRPPHETADPLEFLARVLVHIPDKGHVTTRYDGWYANRSSGMREKAALAAAAGPPAIVPVVVSERSVTASAPRWYVSRLRATG